MPFCHTDYSAIIYKGFDAFKNKYNYVNNLEIDLSRLEIVTNSWISDLKGGCSTKYEQSASLMYWIAITEPKLISILPSEHTKDGYSHPLSSDQQYVAVNAIFAFELGITIVGHDITQVKEKNEKQVKDLINRLGSKDVTTKSILFWLKILCPPNAR